tara:strand:+ start:918 stop:1313 length:396 start_codon:yes stop_codon:yes gene_type:complete
MTATAQDVRNLDLTNSFGLVSDGKIDCLIAGEVSCYVNEAAFGDCATKAQALVAAHLLTLGLGGGSSPTGAVTSESAGGLSRSYASAPTSEAGGFWASTSYGQRYWAIASTRITTPMVLYADGVNPDAVAL